MPKDLSFNEERKDVANFYTKIQLQVEKEVTQKKKLPLSHKEFEGWVKENMSLGVDSKIIDIGPGLFATFLRILRNNGYDNLSAIDINSDTVEQIKENYKFINMHQGSVVSLPFEDNTFDFVICYGVCHHTPTPDKAIEEVIRIVKPGGYCYLGLYLFKDSIFEYIVRIWRLFGKLISYELAHKLVKNISSLNRFVLDHTYVPILYLYSHEEVVNLVEANGCRVIESKPNKFDIFQKIPILGRLLTGGGLLRYYYLKKE